MSQASDKIYQTIDEYIRQMGELGKKVDHVHVTKKQFKVLEDNFKKNQAGSLFTKFEFKPDYRGISIEVYE